jgi:hypothetical protein
MGTIISDSFRNNLTKATQSVLVILTAIAILYEEKDPINFVFIVLLSITFLFFILTEPIQTMKADQARILTNESLNSKYQELEQHPEYLAICDKIRAAAIGDEQTSPASIIEIDIFNKYIPGALERDGFKVRHLTKDNYDIRW